jgi:hypothetical protein
VHIKPSKRRSTLFWVILILLALAGTEVVSYVLIGLANPFLDAPIRRTTEILSEQTELIEQLLTSDEHSGGDDWVPAAFDPELGYTYYPDYHRGHNHINSQGLRSLRVYEDLPDEGVIRAASFGDSFGYCNEVANEESWPTLIEQSHPNIEVLNYGVGAYGTAQAFLRFIREGRKLSPNVVIIGFTPVMMKRTVSVYRRFLVSSDYPLVKPRYTIGDGGELTLIQSPLRQLSDYERFLEEPRAIRDLGRHDHWYRPLMYENVFFDYSATVRLLVSLYHRMDNRYLNPDRIVRGGVFNESSTAFQIQTELLEMFFIEAAKTSELVFVVIFPDRSSILAGAEGSTVVYDPLVRHLDVREIPHLDLLDAFLAAGDPTIVDSWFMPGGHYSPAGNAIVAAQLAQEINQHVENEGGAGNRAGSKH